MTRKVVVYAKPDDFKPRCQPCIATKRWLDARGLDYEVVDASIPENADRAHELTGFMQAPVVIVYVDDEIVDKWYGFDPGKLNSLLQAA